MNARIQHAICLGTVLAVVAVAIGQVGTAFNYQGRVRQGAQLVNDDCDFSFTLWDDEFAGAQQGGDVDQTLTVAEGLFSTSLNFGPGVLDGQALWLEIAVSCPVGMPLTLLSPRQPLSAAPYASYALSAAPGSSLDAADGSPIDALTVDNDGNVQVAGTIDGVDLAAHAADPNAHHTPPTTLPPSGPAGGDLGGSYPNPSVDNDSHTHGDGTISDDITINNGTLFAPQSGNVGIGTTQPVGKLDVRGGIELVTATPFIDFHFGSNTTQDWNFRIINGSDGALSFKRPDGQTVLYMQNSNNRVGINTTTPSARLGVNGNICATGTIGACSDARFKRNVQTIGNAMDIVRQLRGVKFDWKREEFKEHDFDKGRQIGFIAQEVLPLVPEAVRDNDGRFYTVDYSRLTPVLVEGLKAMHAELRDRDAELDALRCLFDDMQARIAALEEGAVVN